MTSFKEIVSATLAGLLGFAFSSIAAGTGLLIGIHVHPALGIVVGIPLIIAALFGSQTLAGRIGRNYSNSGRVFDLRSHDELDLTERNDP